MVEPANITVIYDGDCPFCDNYVRLLRLRESLGNVTLINAREGGELVSQIFSKGYDLDEGMVLMMNGEIYHGADCIHRLAMVSTGNSLFNKINAFVFQSKMLTRLFYPIMRSVRNGTLWLLGKSKLNVSG